MKFIILIFSLFVLFFSDINCQNRHQFANPNPEAKFTALVDNQNWVGECFPCFTPEEEQYLCFYPYDYDNHIVVKIKYNGIGEYSLLDSVATLVKTIGGDVLNGIFYSFGDPNDKVVITHYDETNKFIDGYFQFKLKRSPNIIYSESKQFRAYFFNSK